MITSDIKELSDDSVDGDRRDVRGGRDASFRIKLFCGVDQHVLVINDPVVDGRKILREAGLEPAGNHVLVQLMHPGTRSIGLDEDVDLRESGREEFWAFESDRTFNFTVAELGYEWGEAAITEATLRFVADVPDAMVLVLEREDEPDDILEENAVVDLGERKTEHIRIDRHPDTFEIKIIYDGLTKPLSVSIGETMGDVRNRALALFGGIQSPHLLSLFDKKGNEMQDGQSVKDAKVRKGDKLLLRPSTVRAG